MNLRLSPASRPLTLDISGEVHAPHIWRFLSSCGAQVIGMDRQQQSCRHGLFDRQQQDLPVEDQILNTQLYAFTVVPKLCRAWSHGSHTVTEDSDSEACIEQHISHLDPGFSVPSSLYVTPTSAVMIPPSVTAMLIHAKNVLSNAAESKMDIMRRLVMVMGGCQDKLGTSSDVSRQTTINPHQ